MFDLIGRAYAVDFPTLHFFGTGSSFSAYASKLLSFVLIVTAVLAVVYLVYGGIMYITAGGDAEKATKGRTAVINAVIGVIIVLLAYIIVAWVGKLATGSTP